MYSITFECKQALALVEGASPRLHHDFSRSTLLYNIYFSSPVTIRLENGSISLRFNTESQAEIRSIKFFSVNTCHTHLCSSHKFKIISYNLILKINSQFYNITDDVNYTFSQSH